MNKCVDTSELPHHGMNIDWKGSVGHMVPFTYGKYNGQIKIVNWRPDSLLIQYNNICEWIGIRQLQAAKLGKVLKYRNYDWIYNIGDEIVIDSKKNYVVIDRKYKKTAMAQKSRYYVLKCSKCEGIFEKIENEVTRGCPICANRNIIPEINSFWITDQDIASQLRNPYEAKKYSIGMNVKLDWICESCGDIIRGLTPAQVKKAFNRKVPCPRCSDYYSYPNKFMFNLLRKIGTKFENEKSFEWENLRGRRYDFYLSQYSTIIEMHGGQHYGNVNKEAYEQIKINDIEKENLAKENGIEHYIVIDCSKSNPNYIFKNIKDSDLRQWLDFSSINVQEIDEISQKKIFERAIELGPRLNYSYMDIGKELGIDRATVANYYKKAEVDGRIDKEIVSKLQLENKKKIHYQLDGTPIFCKELNIYFGSYSEIEKWGMENFKKKLSKGSIKQAIQRSGTCYGYHWLEITRKIFNEMKNNKLCDVYGDYFEKLQKE